MAVNAIQTALRNTLCDAFVDAIDGGTPPGIIEIHTAAFGALLATLTFSNPAYGASATGTAEENAITSDTSADATGTAALLRVLAGPSTTLFEGTVGTSGQDLNFNSVAFVTGDTVSITDLPVTMPAA